jgi:endogenous inhibitor of DNA gyrase (YacG/DUF329 family)
MSICPICGGEVAPRTSNKLFPFCGQRCKSIDLGKWLSEDYRIPVDDPVTDEDLRAAEAAGSHSKGPVRH